MFNQITLLGNLTRDIELKHSSSGSAIANTAIATSHKFTVNGEKREETMFVDLTFFGKSAETANSYLRKGSKVLIVGRLKQDNWVDQSGQKKSKHGVIVETMKMLDTKQDGQQQSQSQQSYQAPQQQQQYQQSHTDYKQPQAKAQMPDPRAIPNIDIDEDEIPF
jgi:single-strand DNA-binding protein